MLRDVKVDPYNHKEILPSFFLLIVLPVVFTMPIIFLFFLLVLSFPVFFLLLNTACLFFSFLALLIGYLYKKRRLVFWRASFWLGFIFGIFWMASFVSGFSNAFSAHLGLRMPSSQIRFPMGDIKSIAVDSKGRIYCADGSDCRLQVFSSDGQFLIGWFVPIANGEIQISVTNNNYLRVDNISYKKTYIYNSHGRLIRFERDKHNSKINNSSNKLSCYDDDGNSYVVNKTLFSWQIIKHSENEKLLLVADPFFLKILSKPFTAFCLSLFSLIIIGCLHTLLTLCKNTSEHQIE